MTDRWYLYVHEDGELAVSSVASAMYLAGVSASWRCVAAGSIDAVAAVARLFGGG